MSFFEVVTLQPGMTRLFVRSSPKEKLIVGAGRCRIAYGANSTAGQEGTNLDLEAAGAQFFVDEVEEKTILIRMCGHWGDELGGSGLWQMSPSASPHDNGDPVAYRKETDFDSHYHDCDEYWIIYEGSGVAVSEGQFYEFGPGDCIATGMGHHHDVQIVHQPIRAAYFETTLAGLKRRGHLWAHTHGRAEPKAERV